MQTATKFAHVGALVSSYKKQLRHLYRATAVISLKSGRISDWVSSYKKH